MGPASRPMVQAQPIAPLGERWTRPCPTATSSTYSIRRLLGAWPPSLSHDDPEGMQDLAERLEAYMIKAVREGKGAVELEQP